jgi:hypothetical protein
VLEHDQHNEARRDRSRPFPVGPGWGPGPVLLGGSRHGGWPGPRAIQLELTGDDVAGSIVVGTVD